MDVLRSLPREPSFDCVIADPPYNHGIWRNEPVADYAAWCEEWLLECMARLREGGLLYCYGWPEYLAHVAVRFPVKKQRWLQWIYRNRTTPTKSTWQRAHESILALWNDKPVVLADQIREPYIRSNTGDMPSDSRYGKPLAFHKHPDGALPRDFIDVSSMSGHGSRGDIRTGHPTQKPAPLTKRLLRAVLKDGVPGAVLVPFAGSGSECRVAQSMGHRYLGIELDEQWVRLARETLAATEPML